MSDPPLPDLDEGVLDDDGLDALITDISALGQEVSVRARGADALSSSSDLRAALAALRCGAVVGVQLTYRYRDTLWVDTVLRAPSGWRVVRMAAQR